MKQKAKTPPDAARTLYVEGRSEGERGAAIAQLALNPAVQAAVTTGQYDKGLFENLELGEMVGELSSQVKAVRNGDLGRAETMLITQAHTLDAIFNNLARRAAANLGEYLQAGESYLRLALKAQSQCRATVETLAEIKNPAVIYARQANVTTGPQQVNNGVPSRAREIETEQSKLSGGSRELLPDTRASQNESRINPPVGAVDKVHRA